MGIAVLTMSGLFAPLQGLAAWFVSTESKARVQGASRRVTRSRPAWLRAPQHEATQGKAAQAMSEAVLSRPLRVLRVLDTSHACGNAGRLVISGRMADVCAELDRLASCEGTRN